MKLSYSDLKKQFLRNVGKPDSTETNLLADFDSNLGQRYQMVMSKMSDYMTQTPKTASTVASQQYYHYPVGVANIENVVITVGNVQYPLGLVNSQSQWDFLNAMQLQPSGTPQFFFPRRDDFGIWPTPQDAYTITLNFHYRDRNLSIADVTGTGGVLTNASATFTDAAAIFLPNMVGLHVQVTDTTDAGWGYWYRIAAYNSATSLSLENTWQSTTVTGATYRIGQTPEIPEEGHILLVDGVTADFYAGMRNDLESATWFNNRFWTGDGANSSRDESNKNIKGGLIGLLKDYSDRNRSVLVRRQPRGILANKLWSTTLSD